MQRTRGVHAVHVFVHMRCHVHKHMHMHMHVHMHMHNHARARAQPAARRAPQPPVGDVTAAEAVGALRAHEGTRVAQQQRGVARKLHRSRRRTHGTERGA